MLHFQHAVSTSDRCAYRQGLGGVPLRQDECTVSRVPAPGIVSVIQLLDAHQAGPLGPVRLLEVLLELGRSNGQGGVDHVRVDHCSKMG